MQPVGGLHVQAAVLHAQAARAHCGAAHVNDQTARGDRAPIVHYQLARVHVRAACAAGEGGEGHLTHAATA